MDYPCAKFGVFSFSCFSFIVRTDGQTDRIADAAKRLTPATVVSVSNYHNNTVLLKVEPERDLPTTLK